VHIFTRECQSHWRKNFLPYVCYVATIPCESLRHKSNTFHTILALCTCLYRSDLGQPVSTKQTKHSRKSESQNLCSKCPVLSTIHANKCIQTTMPLRNRCRYDGVHGPAAFTPSADVLSTFNVLSTHIMDPRVVHPLLKHTPDAVGHRIQIWRIGDHISGGINSGVSLCSMVTVSRARCAGAPSC